MIITTSKVVGMEALQERLSYLRDPDAKRIGKQCAGEMSRVYARTIRAFIPREIRPTAPGNGIGSRNTKGKMSRVSGAKAGIGVGIANARANAFKVVNIGHAGASKNRFRFNDKKRTVKKSTGRKFRNFLASRRKTGFITAANLHWFALGTKDRYTGTRTWRVKSGGWSKSTGKARRFTGRIRKEMYGGFVQRGAAAAEREAVQAAQDKCQKMIAADMSKAKRGGF